MVVAVVVVLLAGCGSTHHQASGNGSTTKATETTNALVENQNRLASVTAHQVSAPHGAEEFSHDECGVRGSSESIYYECVYAFSGSSGSTELAYRVRFTQGCNYVGTLDQVNYGKGWEAVNGTSASVNGQESFTGCLHEG
jgi:hypothetical protein